MLFAVLVISVAADSPDFNKDVVPLFKKYCVGCHNADEAKGGFDLSTHQSLLEGGKTGKAIVAGKAADSLLVQLTEGRRKPKMPPKDHPAPTADELLLVKKWIDAGAKSTAAAVVTKFEPFSVKSKISKKPPVTAVAFSPDGNLLAVASGSRIRLVNHKSDELVAELAPHAGVVNAIRFVGDDRMISAGGTAGHAGEIRLWEIKSKRLIRNFTGHRDALYALDVTKDGKRFATAGYDRDIRVWETDTGKLLQTLKGHNDALYALAFSPDGTKLASASGDRTIKLWDPKTGERLDTFTQPLLDQYAVTFAPSGHRLLAGGADNRIRIYEISDTGKEGTNRLIEARFAHESSILKLAYSADGTKVVSTSQDRVVKLWKSEPFSETIVLTEQPDWPNAAAFSPDGSLLAIGRHDGSTALFETSKQSTAKILAMKPKPPVPPVISSVQPPGLHRGSKTSLRIVGSGLNDVKLEFSANGVVAVVDKLSNNAKGMDVLAVTINCPKSQPLGQINIVAKSNAGTSAPVRLDVDDFPQLAEREPNDLSKPIQVLNETTSVWGAISKSGDSDVFAFKGKLNQTLVVDLMSSAFASKLTGRVSVVDSEGTELASVNRAGSGADPLLAYEIPKDGTYLVRVSDAMLAGSPQHRYRATIGVFPVVTGVFPLGVAPKQTTEIELVGHNLGNSRTIKVTSNDPGSLTLPEVDGVHWKTSRSIVVGQSAEFVEKEPNDGFQQATRMLAPGTANGRIARNGGDVDCFRFSSKAGESWIIETDAARRGTPIDTSIEVLDQSGEPIPKMLLQAVRDANIHFRHINSSQLEIRTTNWTEMELNDYLYMDGEVGRYFRLPQGPDSGFLFYSRRGVRLSYFDTSPTAHALGDPIYIVKPHPVDAKLTPSGLPVFRLNYRNDDSGDRTLGTDSRLQFTAPKDGDYIVRIVDSRNQQSDRHAYRLTVRKPEPDFEVSISGRNPTIPAGSGKEIGIFVDRKDYFDEEVFLKVDGLPKGFHVPPLNSVQAGHNEATLVLFADRDAPKPDPKLRASVTAWAMIHGKRVEKKVGDLGEIKLGPKPKILVRLEPQELTIEPGGSVSATLSIERSGFDGRVNFDFQNLPHGVFVDNIGLSGILVREKETTRQVFITARNWVPETSRPFFALGRAEGNQASPPLILHVRKPKQTAKSR